MFKFLALGSVAPINQGGVGHHFVKGFFVAHRRRVGGQQKDVTHPTIDFKI